MNSKYKPIGTTIKHWKRPDTMYQLTLSARYRSKNTGKFSNLIETHSALSDSKTLITSETECIRKGVWDCGVRYGWGLNWILSETLVEQWIKYVKNPKKAFSTLEE